MWDPRHHRDVTVEEDLRVAARQGHIATVMKLLGAQSKVASNNNTDTNNTNTTSVEDEDSADLAPPSSPNGELGAEPELLYGLFVDDGDGVADGANDDGKVFECTEVDVNRQDGKYCAKTGFLVFV